MNTENRKRRLLLRRIIVCLVCVGVLALLIFGVAKGAAALMKIVNPGGAAAQTGLSPSSGSSLQAASSAALSAPSSAKAASSQARSAPAPAAPPPSSAPPLVTPKPGTAAPAGWFRDAVFVGDSRTEGLENYDGLDGATYYAVKGLMVDTIYTKEAIRSGGSKITVMQALQRKKFGKVYIMLGVNELGWSSFATFVSDYGKVVDDIRKYQPGTRIYLEAILPVTAEKSKTDGIYNNTRIAGSNDAIRKLAAEKKVTYLAVDEAVRDASGALPSEATVDGIHLNAAYCKKWCDYLKTHR